MLYNSPSPSRHIRRYIENLRTVIVTADIHQGLQQSPWKSCDSHNVVVWPSGIGQVSPPIHPLTSSQGAVFLINSCQRYFSCGPYCYGQALFRSYGWFFAEFLGDLSLVRLGLLDLNTCVGLRYGSYIDKFRRFSRKRALRHLQGRTPTFALCSELPSKTWPGFSWINPLQHALKSNNKRHILHFVPSSLYIKVMEY